MKCCYLGEFEANVDDAGFVTWACFHPDSGNSIETPADCPVVFGNPCLFEDGPFEEPVKES